MRIYISQSDILPQAFITHTTPPKSLDSYSKILPSLPPPQALLAEITHIARSNPTTLTLAPSNLEGSTPALFIRPEKHTPNGHTYATRSPREVFHVHSAAEGSCHAVLSAADAKLVLEKGWGERHGLSGRALGFPLGYVMIFAPRGVEDVRGVVGRVARAAVRYALEGGEVV